MHLAQMSKRAERNGEKGQREGRKEGWRQGRGLKMVFGMRRMLRLLI